MDESQLLALLAHSFPFIDGYPELKVVPVALLKRLRKVPPEYLKILAEEAALRETLEMLPMGVQQQAWEQSRGLFERKAAPLLDKYA